MDEIVRAICHNLGHTDQALRRKGLRDARDLLKKNPELDQLSLQKVCKGLYYCLWMLDDYVQVHRLALDIIQIYKHIKPARGRPSPGPKQQPDMDEVDLRLAYLKCLLETICREWLLLDKNRVDKMLLFTRILVSEILYYMDELAWDPLVLNKLSEMYTNPKIFGPDCLGLQLHVIQIYLNELILNHEHLSNADPQPAKRGRRGKKEAQEAAGRAYVCKLDPVKLLYVLKPFILMAVTSRDKLVLQAVHVYIFKNLEKLDKIASVSIVLHLLRALLEADAELGAGAGALGGANKKYLAGALKLFENRPAGELTAAEKLHAEQLLYSIFPAAAEGAAQEAPPAAPAAPQPAVFGQPAFYGQLLNGTPGHPLLARDYISLSNLVTRKMSRRRLQNLCVLNSTKNYLKLTKSDDSDRRKFLRKLEHPRVQNQLFFYSLTRLRRLKLQFRFKNYELNKIYNFNKELKSNFNVNLQQAIDNMRNIKPAKSSLMSHDGSKAPRRKKRVVFNLNKNQVTSIPGRKKRPLAPQSCIILPDKYVFATP